MSKELERAPADPPRVEQKDYERLRSQALAIEAMLREAGCGSSTLPEAVAAVVRRAEDAEAKLATLKDRCPTCSGSGDVPRFGGRIECSACKGTGKATPGAASPPRCHITIAMGYSCGNLLPCPLHRQQETKPQLNPKLEGLERCESVYKGSRCISPVGHVFDHFDGWGLWSDAEAASSHADDAALTEARETPADTLARFMVSAIKPCGSGHSFAVAENRKTVWLESADYLMRFADVQPLQAEIERLKELEQAIARAQATFGHGTTPCQCVFCVKDLDGIMNLTFEYEMSKHAAIKRAEAAESALAALREQVEKLPGFGSGVGRTGPWVSRAARTRREEMNWQSINTAPKDGTRILVWAIPVWGASRVDIARWCQMSAIGDGYWSDCDGSPTHWMPLPDPPGRGERQAK